MIPDGLVYNTQNFVLTRYHDATVAFAAEDAPLSEEALTNLVATQSDQIRGLLKKRFAFLQSGAMGFSVESVLQNDLLTVCRLRQTCNGRPIFANTIEIIFTSDRVVQLKGLWLFGTLGESGSLQCKDAASLLLTNKQRFFGEKVLSTFWGYYTSVQDDGNAAVLTPCWAVETEKNTLYFDAVSGEEMYW